MKSPKIDIHNYARRVERTLDKIRDDERLNIMNRMDILKFYRQIVADGLSAGRVAKYLFTLHTLSSLLNKPFREAAKDDIIGLVTKIEGKNYTDWTKHDYKVVLKIFYRWLRGVEKPDYPEEVKWIHPVVKRNNRMPEEILTEDEVKKIVQVTDNPRDRALILVLYESGCRISELFGIRIKHVQFDDYGAVLSVNGKTGSRRIRIIASEPELRQWINGHPMRDDPEAPVWIVLGTRNKYNVPTYATANHLLRKYALKAGIKKDVNPHAFRHARATHLAKNLTEAQLKQMFGWVQGSDVASTYVHLSGRDIDDALFQLNGLEVEKKKEEKFKVRICPRCETKNSPVAKYCQKCSFILDKKLASEREERVNRAGRIIDYIVENEEYKKELEKLFDKIGKDKLRSVGK